MKIKQQREYIETLMWMWAKTARVCGVLSKPERAMLVVLHEEWLKLLEMEGDCECSARGCGFLSKPERGMPDVLRKEWATLIEMEEEEEEEEEEKEEDKDEH